MRQIDFSTDLLPLKNRIFRLALRITLNRTEAEDITQDTLVKAWSKRNELSEVESIESYCLTICRNLSIDRNARCEARNLSLDEQEMDTEDRSPDPGQQLEQKERHRQIKSLFDRLPERQRTILQLRDIEGKSVRETAAVLNLSEENVKVILHRARQTLRQQYLKLESYGL